MKKKRYALLWICAGSLGCAGMYQTEKFLLKEAKNVGGKLILNADALVKQGGLIAGFQRNSYDVVVYLNKSIK